MVQNVVIEKKKDYSVKSRNNAYIALAGNNPVPIILEVQIGEKYSATLYEDFGDIFLDPLPSRHLYNFEVFGLGTKINLTKRELDDLALIPAFKIDFEAHSYILAILHESF